MDNTIKLEATVIDHKKGVFTSEEGKEIRYNNLIVSFGGREVAFKCDYDKVQAEPKDKVELTIQITPRPKTQEAVLKVVGCETI